MTKHVEFTIDFDLSCWGQDMEDFPEGEDITCAKEEIDEYFSRGYNVPDLLDKVKIKKIWFEDD